MLERNLHRAASFTTLTYSDENLPVDGSVVPEHLQLFMKRVRRRLHPAKVRFYGVGEYGDDKQRPHYHLALFGVGVLGSADCRVHYQWAPKAGCTCKVCVKFRNAGQRDCNCVVCESWEEGHVHNGDLTPESASYIVSYVTKFTMGRKDFGGHLNGRHPEFARMSLRPGIGAGAARAIIDAVEGSVGWDVYLGRSEEGVPGQIRRNGKLWPLGRYIRRKVRAELGLGEAESARVIESVGRKMQDELRIPGARVDREGKREQQAKIAAVRDQISRSKKGLGL